MVSRDGGRGAGLLDVLLALQERLPAPVAPHVARHLATVLADDVDAVVETAGVLTSDQLAGLSLLPDPLPAVPAVRRAVAPLLASTTGLGRRVLLTLAVQVVDRTDALLRATDLDLDALLADPVVDCLDLVAGHVRIRDPRVRAVVHEDASVAERTSAHRALAAAHADDDDVATWHRALACLAGDADVAPRLVATAERMLARGEAAWAQRVAREATSHATGRTHAAAVAVAGRAALHAGHVADAADLLREALRGEASADGPDLRTALLVAVSHLTGQVPQELVDRDGSSWAHLVAAVLHAARGDVEAAEALVAGAGTPGARTHGDGAEVDLATAAITLLAGRAPVLAVGPLAAHETDPVRRAMVACLRAVALAAEGRVDVARGVLAAALTELAPLPGERAWRHDDAHDDGHGDAQGGTGGAARQARGCAMTPLVEAHVRLVEAVLEAWAGNLGGATSVLTRAAGRLPVGQCLGGAAAVVAGRASVLAHGERGLLSDTLERLAPLPLSPAVRTGLLTDRALGLLIQGEPRGAATLFGLCAERGCPGEIPLPTVSRAEAALLVGDLDRTADRTADLDAPDAVGPAPEPSALALALVPTLRARLELASAPVDVDAQVQRALQLDRAVESPVERGITRLVCGQALLRAGRPGEGRDHLSAAVGLLEGGGAGALADVARRLLDRAGTHARVALR
ncbi:hypothetical protein ICW40_17975, partial [Actinotalea ferrariae]|uniref:hypothetical protein n=1 Tax=Actinotalea ferrariae TaxID=1386098 RepID=UPI001C8C7113